MNIDAIIVFGYLIITLIYGLYVGRGVKNINDYALGGRNFTTPVLAATIIATHASSSGLFLDLTKSYEDGIYKILATFGQTLRLLFTAYIIAPRMSSFMGKLSVAEMMGDLYGKNMRIISSLPIFLVSSGFVAVQIKVLSSTFSYFTYIGNYECVIISSIVVTLYSAFGGIRAVTFTDVVQALTFGVAIPIIFLLVYSSLDFNTNLENRQELFSHLFAFDSDKTSYYFVLFIYLLIPSLSPPAIQRMLMARDTNQIFSSYKISAFFLFGFIILFNMLGAMIYVANPNIESNMILPYIIDNYTEPGIRGIMLIGIIALAMSTADSNLNAGSVSFSHDFCRPLGIFKNTSELFISKIFSILVGAVAIILALSFEDIISLILFIYNFYAPVITVPLMLAIFGFKSSTRSVVIGILCAMITVYFWDYIRDFLGLSKNISSFIPGMLAHLIGLLFTHYIMGEKGDLGAQNLSPGKIKATTNDHNSCKNKKNYHFNFSIENFFTKNIPHSNLLFNNLAIYMNCLFFISLLFIKRIGYSEIVIFSIISILSILLLSCNLNIQLKNYLIKPIYFISCLFSFPFATSYLLLSNNFEISVGILAIISLSIMPLVMRWKAAL